MQATLKLFINGRWETGVTLGISENPMSQGDVVAEFARADAIQTETAARAADQARRSWAGSEPQRRADVLSTIAAELLARQDELARLIAREAGRPVEEAQAEAVRAGQLFRFFADEVLRQAGGERATGKPSARAAAPRTPVGAVALIAASQFPLAIPAEQIAPALAFGNTVVFKPAERASACGWALAEIVSRAGLPAGVFNLVMGSGRLVGQTLVDSPLIAAVCFAGSAAIGEGVRQRIATRRAKVQLLPLPVRQATGLQASIAGGRALGRRAAEFFTLPAATRLAATVSRA